MGAQTNLNIAVLIDYQKKDKQNIENLYRRKLLAKSSVFTYGRYVGSDEADVEDMFEPEFYLRLVNGAFGTSITVSNLKRRYPRILRRIEEYLTEHPLPDGASFNHYRPARYLAANTGAVESGLTDAELDRFQRAFDAVNALLQGETSASGAMREREGV